jgi:hypothetical protein
VPWRARLISRFQTREWQLISDFVNINKRHILLKTSFCQKVKLDLLDGYFEKNLFIKKLTFNEISKSKR